jgi:hypothetical protein
VIKTKNSFWLVFIVCFLAGLVSCNNHEKEKETSAPSVAPVPTFQAIGPKSPIEGYFDRALYSNGNFIADGWSVDKVNNTQAAKVTLYIDDKLLGEATLGKQRADVAATYKNPNWTSCGWVFTKKVSLNQGSHRVYALAEDKQGTAFKLLPDQTITAK